MFNFIKVKDNTWLNINNIIYIEYYPNGDGIYQFADVYYLIICTNDTETPYYVYDSKEEAMDVIEKLNQHGIFLDGNYDKSGDIIPDAVKEDKGDTISREALKKTLCEEYEAREHYIGEIMLKAIDNAPTVSDRYGEGYAQGYIDGSTGADWKGGAENDE